MTDAMLRLARVFHPNAYTDSNGTVWTGPKGSDNEVFDPANNADQFCDVLAWMLKNWCISMHGMPHCVGRWTIEVEGPIDNDEVVIDHDGTASGIRTAVVQAAMSVEVCDGIR